MMSERVQATLPKLTLVMGGNGSGKSRFVGDLIEGYCHRTRVVKHSPFNLQWGKSCDNQMRASLIKEIASDSSGGHSQDLIWNLAYNLSAYVDGTYPACVTIQYPEITLSPENRARLASVVVRRSHHGPVVVETGSREILRQVQIEILLGNISHKDVHLWWCEKTEEGFKQHLAVLDDLAAWGDWPGCPHTFDMKQCSRYLDLQGEKVWRKGDLK